MTTTIENISTPLPTKTSGMSWDAFAEAIAEAEQAERARLMEAFPTPAITAKSGTPAWNDEWLAQRTASEKRDDAFYGYCSKLIVEIGKALASTVPMFCALDIDYEGAGDNGEACSITVRLNRVMSFDEDGKFIRWTDEQNQAYLTQYKEAQAVLPTQLTEWMDETCWAIAYQQHPGFEINEGGFGCLTVAPANEDDPTSPLQLTITHTERTEHTYEPSVLA